MLHLVGDGSRSIDARVAVAALKAAIRIRQPPKGCIHHSDRGSQYASETYRNVLVQHGLVGSMGRRGNPYDNAKAESFMKTLKVEAVYLTDYQTFEDVTARESRSRIHFCRGTETRGLSHSTRSSDAARRCPDRCYVADTRSQAIH